MKNGTDWLYIHDTTEGRVCVCVLRVLLAVFGTRESSVKKFVLCCDVMRQHTESAINGGYVGVMALY